MLAAGVPENYRVVLVDRNTCVISSSFVSIILINSFRFYRHFNREQCPGCEV